MKYDHNKEIIKFDNRYQYLYMEIKYIIDCFLIVLFLPLILLISIITSITIKISDGGPIFFKQSRVGLNGKEFLIFKFRTMKQETRLSSPEFAKLNDGRIIKNGEIIRKYRIDEIPQFINVLKREMSLIGPRPEQVFFVKEFSKKIPSYDLRHSVRPGITGWAQVNQGYTDSLNATKEKLKFDLYYIKNFGIRMDTIILFKTIKTILSGFGAR